MHRQMALPRLKSQRLGRQRRTGEANGSAADVDMKDAAGPSDGASGDSDLHKGQLTGKETPSDA